jgi:cytochrome P450
MHGPVQGISHQWAVKLVFARQAACRMNAELVREAGRPPTETMRLHAMQLVGDAALCHDLAGDGLLPVISVVNHDLDALTLPDTLDIQRPTPHAHLWFGEHTHLCQHHKLARAELRDHPDLRRATPFMSSNP